MIISLSLSLSLSPLSSQPDSLSLTHTHTLNLTRLCSTIITVHLTGNLDTCDGVPTFYSIPFTQAFIETYDNCGFDNAGFCTGTSAGQEACLAYFNSIFPGETCGSRTYAEFFVAGVQYMTPWAFIAGVVIICCGGAVVFMTVPAFCL